MDSNPIHHPSPAKKNEMLVFGLRSLLMICLADWWTWTSSATFLLPKKWNAQFSITFNFWWSAKLVNWPKVHLPALSSQKNEMLTFGLCLLRMISQAGRWTQTPSINPLQPIKWNAHFFILFNFWWSAGLVNGLKPHPPPLSSQRNEMLIFVLCSTSDDRLGWSMDSNPILHLSPAKEMKCSFLYYVQLLMIGWADWWTRTPFTTPLQPKQWNVHFCITFYMWCWPDWSMNLNLIHHPSPAKKWNAHFWVMFIFWWLVRLLYELKPHLPPLSSQIKWNAHFWITFNFWWSAGLVDGLEPHPPPVSCQKMKCTYFDYVQLLMIGQAGQWTWTPSTTPLQPKKMKCPF